MKEIRNTSGEVIYTSPSKTIAAAMEEAAKKGADLPRLDLRNQDLRGAKLAGLSAPGADLSGALLESADLTRAQLAGANFAGTSLICADFSQARAADTCFRSADLTRAKMLAIRAPRTDLSWAYLTGTDMRSAVLVEALMSKPRIFGTNFTRARLADVRIAHGEQLVGDHPILQISPVGRMRHVTIYQTNKGIRFDALGVRQVSQDRILVELERQYGDSGAIYRAMFALAAAHEAGEQT